TATFADPDPNDSGTISFQVCADAGCASVLQSFATASGVANGTNGTASVPTGLADGTYYWRAKGTDQSNNDSAYSASRSFVVDTTAPTITGAQIAADGSTVTVTWSEPLDSLQALPGSAFTVNAIAGTGTVAYGAGNTTTSFTLASPVHHLDLLSLAYTKPGSNPMIRDAASPTGNPAAGTTGIPVTNNTADATPTVPALVSPANNAQLASATPTLTGTFAHPDTNDTGKLTFQICADAACTTVLQSFDSSSTSRANGANGSAAAASLADGTYYWRAKNTDSSANASAYSATRTLTVDTTPPTMTSATIASNGTTVTVTWSENLDQSQAVSGTAFAVAPNGGAAIAGTPSAVTYPAANQTRFTLTAAVHHLDNLTLTYARPGSDPMIRDTAQPTGNAAATAPLGNGSIANSTTNAAPSTPTLVDPPDGSNVGSYTPQLTAVFTDPDTQDTGKLTFEVCADSSCTTSLGTFDSTNTALTNGQQGSGTVPGSYGLTEFGTYYWRAK